MTTPERTFAAGPIVGTPGRLSKLWHGNLVRTVVEQSVGRPDAAVLTFRDSNHELSTKVAIGKPLTVSMTVPEAQARTKLFTGEITALELEVDGTGTYTVVHALGRAHRLQRGRRVFAYRFMSAAMIVRKVAEHAGLTPGKIDVPSMVYRQLSQTGVSDWEFLQDLAAQLGVVMSVDDKGKLDFGPPKPATDSPIRLDYLSQLLSLRAAVTTADQVDSVQVRSWHVETKRALVANVPSKPSTTVRPDMATTKGSFGSATALVVGTPYATDAETVAAANSLATSMSDGLGDLEIVVKGEPRVRAGSAIELTKAGPDFSGKYTATAVRHTIDADTGYRTTVLVTATADRSVAGLTGGVGPRARSPRFPGVATAIVTNVQEPGGKDRGWVRLKFPWLDDDYQSEWVRTVQLGGQGGGVFCPDVNDEVLVAFEQGCLDRPYVIGGLYNGEDLPSPHSMPLVGGTGVVNRRSLVSRKGHRLELIDGVAEKPGVRVASGDSRLEVRLDSSSQAVTVTVYGPGGTDALSSIHLTSSGITVDAGTGTLDLKGATVNIKGTSVNVEGTSVGVKGTTGVNVDGGLLATLRGTMVRIN